MHYVIIGGDAAGMSAAMEIVRKDPNSHVTTIEKGHIYSYGQCGLPYVINEWIPSTEELIARSVETFRSKYGIDAKVGYEVTAIDLENKSVTGTILETGKAFTISYDRLLIATGASPVVPKWPGSDVNGIYTLKTIPHAEAIQADLNRIQHVTIIGGGYIGLEMAESFGSIGKKVRIIQRGSQLASIFDADMAQFIHREAEKHGIELVLEEEVTGFSGNEYVQSVETKRGSYATDAVLLAIGVTPNTTFLKDTSIETARNGAIVVNEFLETNVQDVFAAGDCATHYHRVKKQNDYIPLGTTANKQGRLAGLNMIEQSKAFQGIVGTSILKFFDLTLAKTGLSEQEARQLEVPYEVYRQEASHIAGYYPGKEQMQLKILVRPADQSLLGAQIIGGAGVDKRIDVLATALYHEMTLHDLLDLDLAYAPPFNGVWDPIQQVAKRYGKK